MKAMSVFPSWGMYKGDAARKQNLSEYGYRLPVSASEMTYIVSSGALNSTHSRLPAGADNRPLKFQEWENMRPQTIFVSATPGSWEFEQTQGEFVEQVIRPTGLLDPVCLVRPTHNQVDDLICECQQTYGPGTPDFGNHLDQKMAEALSEYFHEAGIKARYLHSDFIAQGGEKREAAKV